MNIEELITRKTNLETSESLSGFKHYAAQQSHNSYRVFYDFLEKIKPARILEIGTALGGFTDFLNEACIALNLNTKILTYDIYEKPWYNEMIDKGIDVRVKDIFTQDGEDVIQESIDFLQQEGVTIVLCDGGNKIKEFNIYSKYIKSGDFLLAHDYAKDELTFKQDILNKVWNWHEIQESDINKVCREFNLQDYNQEIFNNVAWVCKHKVYEQ